MIPKIISPHDQGISDSIRGNLDPKSWEIDSLISSPLYVDVTDGMLDAYFHYLANLSHFR